MANLLPRATLKAQESGRPDGRASEPLTLVQQDLFKRFPHYSWENGDAIGQTKAITPHSPPPKKRRKKKSKSQQLWAACLDLAPGGRIAQKWLHIQEFLKLHSLKVHAYKKLGDKRAGNTGLKQNIRGT